MAEHRSRADDVKEGSFSEFMTPPKNEDISLIRELLTYSIQCPICTEFVRAEDGNQLRPRWMSSTLHWSRQVEWPWVINKSGLTCDFEPNSIVLDAGSGFGPLRYALGRRCKHVVTVDDDPKVLTSEDVAETIGITNITQVLADLRNLPFFDNYFDCVVCVSVLEHIERDRQVALSEMVRVLKPGGKLLFTMDVVVERTQPVASDLTIKDAFVILDVLNIPHPKEQRMCSTVIPDPNGPKVTVLLACYVKPLEEEIKL